MQILQDVVVVLAAVQTCPQIKQQKKCFKNPTWN